MKTNKEIVEYLNSLKILQISDWSESLPDNIYEEIFEGRYEIMDSNLFVNKHRWYETSIEVIKNNNGFIGIQSVTDCFSEQSSISDMFFTLKFYEMEEILQPTYIIKK